MAGRARWACGRVLMLYIVWFGPKGDKNTPSSSWSQETTTFVVSRV
jgi:hypothetical protein